MENPSTKGGRLTVRLHQWIHISTNIATDSIAVASPHIACEDYESKQLHVTSHAQHPKQPQQDYELVLAKKRFTNVDAFVSTIIEGTNKRLARSG